MIAGNGVECAFNDIDQAIVVLKLLVGDDWLDHAENVLGNVQPGRVWREEVDLMAMSFHSVQEGAIVMKSSVVHHKCCMLPFKVWEHLLLEEIEQLLTIPCSHNGLMSLNAIAIHSNKK